MSGQSNFIPDLSDFKFPLKYIKTASVTIVSVDKIASISPPVFTRGVSLKALPANYGTIYIGSNISSDLILNGYPLFPGDEYTVKTNDASIIYIQGNKVGDQLRYIYGS